MIYQLVIRHNEKTDVVLQESTNLPSLLVIRDKLNGYHPKTKETPLPLREGWAAHVFTPYFQAPAGMDWGNVEESERIGYVREDGHEWRVDCPQCGELTTIQKRDPVLCPMCGEHDIDTERIP